MWLVYTYQGNSIALASDQARQGQMGHIRGEDSQEGDSSCLQSTSTSESVWTEGGIAAWAVTLEPGGTQHKRPH